MKEFADPKARLTQQQERFVFLLASGVPPKAAASGAGYSTPGAPMRSVAVQRAIKFVKEQEKDQIFVNRDKLTSMLFSAHAKAANSTEEIAAIRELGEMHDVYAQAQEDRKNSLHTAVQINHNTVQKLSDDDLLKIAQMTASDLEATKTIEAGPVTEALAHMPDTVTVEEGFGEGVVNDLLPIEAGVELEEWKEDEEVSEGEK